MFLSVQDMHYIVDQSLQDLGIFAYEELEKEEIDLQLNWAVAKFIEGVIPYNLVEGKQLSPNQINLDRLSTIRTKTLLTLGSVVESERYECDLPFNLYRLISVKAVSSTSCTVNGVPSPVVKKGKVRLYNNDEINDARRSFFHKTNKESVLGEITGDGSNEYATTSVTSQDLDAIAAPVTATVATGLSYTIGDIVKFTSDANPINDNFTGTVTSYVSGTGVMTLDTILKTGSGAHTDWTVNIKGSETKNKRLTLFTDGLFTLTEAQVDYIRIPAKIEYKKDSAGAYLESNSVNCDLPDTSHEVIVDMAIQRILTILRSRQPTMAANATS